MLDKPRHHARMRLLYAILAVALAAAAVGSLALHLQRERFQTFPVSSF